MKMNKKGFFLILLCALFGLFWISMPTPHAQDVKGKSSKERVLTSPSFSKDKEIKKEMGNFTHVSLSDTSLDYLSTDADGMGVNSDGNIPGRGLIQKAGVDLIKQLGLDFGMGNMLDMFSDITSFVNGDTTVGCAVLDFIRASLLTTELELNIEKLVEYANLVKTTEDVMKSFGEENRNAVSVILSDAKEKGKDYKDLVKFENDSIGQQRVYGVPQPSLSAARQYVNNTFFYENKTDSLERTGKSLEDMRRDVDAARLAYLNEAVINSLGTSYEYSTIGVEESGEREKDLVRRLINAKNWDEVRAVQALADLNVVREQIVNLSLQMRLLEQMAITNINTMNNAWVVPVSPEKLKENTRERIGQ